VPRPGIVATLEHDLDGLRRLGVSTLVTLEESRTVDPSLLAPLQMASIHFPILDMGAPRLEDAEELCRRIDQLVALGEVVAVHCRAGLGRTGTMLAAQLVFDGESAVGAIERVRRLNPSCIQSDAQVQFLSSFESFLRGRGVTAVAVAS